MAVLSRERIRAPVLLTEARKPRLLLGRARLIEHLRRMPDQLIDAVVVPGIGGEQAELIACLEQVPSPAPSDRALAVRALLDAGMGLAQLVACVPGLGSPAIASRWAALADADPSMLRMLDEKRLTFSHTTLLLPLTLGEQRVWVERCVAGRWSYAMLRRRLIEDRQGAVRRDVDLKAFASALREVLGSEVSIDWSAGGGGTLAFDWFGVEELQGIMERLARGGVPHGPLPARLRRLVIKLENLDELSQLTGHLLRSDA